MISLTKKFAFIHINKAGGTSVVEALAEYEDAQSQVLDHDQAAIYREKLGNALWAEMFSFAFLRNPFDRMVSSYEFRKQYLPDARAAHVLAATKLSFRDWMLGPVHDDPLDREWSNQLWMVCGDEGEGDIMVSQLYLYENLAAGFADACRRIDIETPRLASYNKTKREDWRSYYDADTAALVTERFSRDLAWADEHFPGAWERPNCRKPSARKKR